MTGLSATPREDADSSHFNFNEFKIVHDLSSYSIRNEPYLELIAGDASDRKFFRLSNSKEGTAICMQFPKWEGGYGGDPISWIGMQNALKKMNIPVPEILKIDETNACIWTEDLGDDFLSSILTEEILDIHDDKCEKAIDFYKKAILLLVDAQYPDVDVDHPAHSRFFDFEKLYFEMNFFMTHFLTGLLGLQLNEGEGEFSGVFEDFKLLCHKLDAYEKVLCHRDYHIRNIMLKDKKLHWIDFQDARMGPHSYDVVSLIRDSYVNITWETRDFLFQYYLKSVNSRREHLNLKHISDVDFHLESLLMGLQRNIKAVGSFGYLATKKHKPQYLKYVLPTLDILMSKDSQQHAETDLKMLLPNIFQLVEDLSIGKYSDKLKKIISQS